MQFSKLILKSAFVASAIAAPISADVKVDAAPATGFISKTGSTATGTVSDIKLAIPHVVKRDIPDVGAAVNGVEAANGALPGGSVAARLLNELPVGSTVSGVQSAVEGVVSSVPGVSTVEGAVSGPVSSVVGAVSSTGVLNTATGVVDSATGTLSSVEGAVPSLAVRRALPVDMDSTLSTVKDAAAVGGLVNEVQAVARDVVPAGALTQLGGIVNTNSIADQVGSLAAPIAKRILSAANGPVDTVLDTAEPKVDAVVPTATGALDTALPVAGSKVNSVVSTADGVVA